LFDEKLLDCLSALLALKYLEAIGNLGNLLTKFFFRQVCVGKIGYYCSSLSDLGLNFFVPWVIPLFPVNPTNRAIARLINVLGGKGLSLVIRWGAVKARSHEFIYPVGCVRRWLGLMLKNWGFLRRNAPFYVWMVRYTCVFTPYSDRTQIDDTINTIFSLPQTKKCLFNP